MRTYRTALENMRMGPQQIEAVIQPPKPASGFMPRIAGMEAPQQTDLPVDPRAIAQRTFQSITQAKERFKNRMAKLEEDDPAFDDKKVEVGEGFMPRPQVRPEREQAPYNPLDDLMGSPSESMFARGNSPTGPAGSSALPVNFAEFEARYNLPSGYLERTAFIESTMDPNAQNPHSSAGGLFQFLDDTAEEYGLVNRFDPVEATDAASRLAVNNANQLRRALGRDPTAAELYLAHQQGGTGAVRLLSNPDRPATDFVSADAVRLNGGNVNMTAGEFAGLWIGKFNRR